ncbi:MAG TPA: response regulator [Virgibacillus sp.]|nr:response regulator [Virgibacillus sp.]
MRILIADDELLERKSMKKFIETNFSNMNVVGEAVNGRQAIELAETAQPDIIFMDIKMPGINGLEAIKQINANYPAIKFILVSAYDTFDYAKQAMAFGIKDYILKPGKKAEIVKALLRVEKELSETSRIHKEKQQSERLLKENVVSKLMTYPVQKEMITFHKQLFPEMVSSYFLIARGDLQAGIPSVENGLQENLQGSCTIYQTGEVTVIYVVSSQQISADEQLQYATYVGEEFGPDVYIGIGTSQVEVGQLPTSYREAYAACFQLQKEQRKAYGFWVEQQERKNVELLIGQLVQQVEHGNDVNVLQQYKEMETDLDHAQQENLYIAIQNVLNKWNLSVTSHSIATLKTSQDWYHYLNICCLKISEFHQSKQLMSKAKTYIQTHFHEAMTLEEVAAAVQLSPNYFSNLFKTTFGETFIEYVTRIRMVKAKELIEKNAYSLKEISFMVGYNNPNYFSRVFKKHFAISPKQFQQNIFGK